ncbi:hypothetical protein Tco_0837803 [Tanacetum coccineum]
MNKITSLCEICSGPYDTQYCMKNPEQAFVDYASSGIDKAGGKLITINQEPRNFKEATNAWKESNDRNIIVEDEEIVENESRYSETIVEEDESSDIGCNDETSNPGDRECEDEREIREEGEWMEYDHPLDLLDVRNDEVYEFLIEKMPSCSLNFNFRIEKEDPGNLKIPCMIGNVEANIDPSLPQVVFGRPFMDITKLILDREQGFITFTNEIKEVTFKTPYRDSEMDDLTSEGHDLLSFRVILSEDDVKGHLI